MESNQLIYLGSAHVLRTYGSYVTTIVSFLSEKSNLSEFFKEIVYDVLPNTPAIHLKVSASTFNEHSSHLIYISII